MMRTLPGAGAGGGAFSSPVIEDPFGLSDVEGDFGSGFEGVAKFIGGKSCEPLDRLCLSLGLGDEERFVLLLILGFQIESGWNRYLALLQATESLSASNYLISILFNGLYGDSSLLSRILRPEAPLIRFGVVYGLHNSIPMRQWTLLQLDDGIVEYLLGLRSDSTQGKIALCEAAPERNELPGLVDFLKEDDSRLDSCVVHLFGPGGSEFREAGCFVGGSVAGSVLAVSAKELLESPDLRMALLREVRLSSGSVVVDIADYFVFPSSFEEESLRGLLSYIKDLVRESPGVVVLTGGEVRWRVTLPEGLQWIAAELRLPSREERLELWRSALNGSASLNPGFLEDTVSRYPLTKTQIGRAARDARARAAIRDGRDASLLPGDIVEGVLALSEHSTALVSRVTLRHDWEDLILPPEQERQIQEISNHVKQRDHLWDAWGFRNRSGGSGGIHALFSGKSGTGKTLAASVIARDVGLELLKVDLSMVVSKYIGETEKNISTVFREAQAIPCHLIFR